MMNSTTGNTGLAASRNDGKKDRTVLAAPVRLIDLRTCGLADLGPASGADKRRWPVCAVTLEDERLSVAVGLWRLTLETSQWRNDFAIDRLTATGRELPVVDLPGS